MRPATELTDMPLLVCKAQAARLTGTSARSVDRLVSCGGSPPPVRLGGRVLWNRNALERWVAAGCPGSACRR